MKHAVVIAGGGPTGLMLAAELALAGVDVGIVEQRASQDLIGSRAGGLHSRTIELLDQRGVAERFLAEGKPMQTHGFGYIPLDISDFPTRHNYGLALWQNQIERILAQWVGELAVKIYRPLEVTGFTESADGVDVALSNGESMRARYLVGCDGGRSVVRKAAGIDFPGWDPSVSWMIAEVETTQEPKFGWHDDGIALQAIGKSDRGGARMVLAEPKVVAGEPTLDDLKRELVRIYGTDFGVHSPLWMSRFTDMTRQAASYRKGRILVAGDAANVRAPLGGQGLNLGVHDAVNLGWKLAQVISGVSDDSLLDTYHSERHPVVARVLRNVMAQVALRFVDERTKALKATLGEILVMNEPRKLIAGLLSGLDIHYDLGTGHPLLGRRMPDLDITTSSGSARVFTFLHAARPVLINFAEPGRFDVGNWKGRVQSIDAKYGGTWELPVIGAIEAPDAVLVRPDGYVAWVGQGQQTGLTDALTKWFGAEATR